MSPISLACAMLVPAALAGGPGDIASNFHVYGVPVTIHVVRQGNGAGGLSASRVSQALVEANIGFEQIGITFCQLGPTIFIDDDFYYSGIETIEDYADLKQVLVVPDTINIYFTEEMGCPLDNPADCPNPAICGISSYTFSAVQGIVMRNACTGVPQDASTIAHELGHYFDLYHTQETANGIECPDGSNCAQDGDYICDTAAAPRLDLGNVDEQTCQYTGNETACGDPYDPDPRNHMSYAPKPCRHLFSLQQAARSRMRLVQERPELILDPGCPVPGACSPESGSCSQAHNTPGCSDAACCEAVCDIDLYCCAAKWDATCVWKRSFACLPITIPPWGGPGHAPLGEAVLSIDTPSGALVVSNLGSAGNDGVVAELDFAEGFRMTWLDPDALGTLPFGAGLKLSAMGWTGLPRPKPAGSSQVTKQSGGEVNFVSITADLGATNNLVQIFNGSVLVATATVASGPIATAPSMPTGGGIPATPNQGPRFCWEWSAPVFIQVAGGPSASGDLIKVIAGAGYAKRFAMAGLQGAGMAHIDITGEQVLGPSGSLNDHCESPALMSEGTVPFTGESWYLYVAGCSGPATAGTDSGAPVTVYAGHCGDLQAIGTSTFVATCGAAYLIKVTGGPAGGMLTVTCNGLCPTPCAADVDGDSSVGILDFLALLAAWGPKPGHPADFDGDGLVGVIDFLFLLSQWGPCPSIVD